MVASQPSFGSKLICGICWTGARGESVNNAGESGQIQLPPMTSLHMAWTEIEMALQARLYYLALISTLSLIDICSALESENGETDKHKFMA